MKEDYTISDKKLSSEEDNEGTERMNEEEMEEPETMEEERPSDRKVCSINTGLLSLKLHFMFFFAGIASIMPYLPIFAKQLGLSATGIGIVYFAISVVSIFAKPLFGWMADRFREMKLLVGIMVLTTIGFYVSLHFIPPLGEKPKIPFTVICKITELVIRHSNVVCSLGINRTKTCQISCETCDVEKDGSVPCYKHNISVTNVNVIVNDDTRFILENSTNIRCPQSLVLYCEVYCPCDQWCCDSSSEYLSVQFWGFFISNVFAGMARRVVHSLSDSLCYDMLGGGTRIYEKQRLWGSIGRSVSPAVTGWLLDYAKHGNQYNYSVALCVMVGLLLLDIIAVFWLDLSGNQLKETSSTICEDVISLFSDLKHITFAAIVTVNGVLCGLYFVYYFLFMEEIGASKLLIGLTVLIRLVSLFPSFYFADKIIAKLGHFNAVIISFIAFALRFFSYIYIYKPRWMLLAEISHGFAFGFFYAAMTSYAKHCAPPGAEATFQGLLGALFDGLGMAIGNILGGLGFDYCGSRTTFLVASITSAIGAILTLLFHSYSIYRRRTRQVELEIQQVEGRSDEVYEDFDNILS